MAELMPRSGPSDLNGPNTYYTNNLSDFIDPMDVHGHCRRGRCGRRVLVWQHNTVHRGRESAEPRGALAIWRPHAHAANAAKARHTHTRQEEPPRSTRRFNSAPRFNSFPKSRHSAPRTRLGSWNFNSAPRRRLGTQWGSWI